jgi:hypothetical protein
MQFYLRPVAVIRLLFEIRIVAGHLTQLSQLADRSGQVEGPETG